MTGKLRAVVAAIASTLLPVIAYFGMGGEIHRAFVGLILIYFFAPIVAVEALVAFHAQWRKTALRWLATTAILAALIWTTVPLGRLVQNWEVNRTRSFPDRIQRILEDYRKSNGAYPENLGLLPLKPSTPRLLSKGWGGYAVGYDGIYRFGYRDPDRPALWDYDSTKKVWEEHGD